MYIYIVIILYIFSLTLLSLDKRFCKKKCYILFFISVILITFAGIRDHIGYDYEVYLEHYKEVNSVPNFEKTRESIEIGYEYMVSIFKTFNFPFFCFTLFMAFVTFFLFVRLSLYYSAYSVLSLLMFFAGTFWELIMGQMRQPLAIMILYSFLCLLKKGKVLLLTLATICVSLLFHKSIFSFLLPIFFLTHQLKSYQYGVILISSILIGRELIPFTNIFINWLPDFFFYKDATIAYLTYKAESVTFTLGMIERVAMFLIVTHYCRKYQILEKDKFMLIFYNMYFYGICLYFLLIPFSDILASRGTFVLTWSLFFLFPNTLKYISKKKDFIVVLIVIILWSLYLSTKVFFRDDNIYIPYKSIFS